MNDQSWVILALAAISIVSEVVKSVKKKKKKKVQGMPIEMDQEELEGAPLPPVEVADRMEGEEVGKKRNTEEPLLDDDDLLTQIKRVVQELNGGKRGAGSEEQTVEDKREEGVFCEKVAVAESTPVDPTAWLGSVPEEEGGEGLAAKRAEELRAEELAMQMAQSEQQVSLGCEALRDIRNAMIASFLLEPKFKQQGRRFSHR